MPFRPLISAEKSKTGRKIKWKSNNPATSIGCAGSHCELGCGLLLEASLTVRVELRALPIEQDDTSGANRVALASMPRDDHAASLKAAIPSAAALALAGPATSPRRTA